jgi:hypothetical protein
MSSIQLGMRSTVGPARLAIACLCGWALVGGGANLALAASYTNDFVADPIGAQLFGDAIVENEVLKLTINQNGQIGSMVLDDLDPGKKVAAFVATFKLRIGGGTATPADGFSFSFAPDLPDGAFGEDGAGSGLTVAFDTYDNGGGEAPAIDIRFGGITLATKRYSLLRTGTGYVDVKIQVSADGMADVFYRGTPVLTNVAGYKPIGGRFGFGGRTGGLNDNHWLDNLSIETTPLTTPSVRSAAPVGPNIFADAVVRIELEDWETQVDPNLTKLEFNGEAVTPDLNKVDVVTTVTYDPPGLLAPGSTNTYRITFGDTSNPPVVKSEAYQFVVQDYATLPSRLALPAGAVDRDAPGFRLRLVQARLDAYLPNTLARAEAQLAGAILDVLTGLPFVNEADLTTAGPDGFFVEPEVVNYDEAQTGRGNFLLDELLPGIPGTTLHADNIAAEVLTYLELPAGYIKLGVNSDDGFALRVGSPAQDVLDSIVLGSFDGARGAADTLFSMVTEQAGVYPVRLIWEEGGGEANLEFFSIDATGARVLVNDTSNLAAVPAFRQRSAASPGPPFLRSVEPPPGKTNVNVKPRVKLVLQDDQTAVVPGSVQLFLNDQRVSPQVSQSGNQTTVTYAHPTELEEFSTNRLRVVFGDTDSPSLTQSREWSFVTGVISVPGGSFASDFAVRPAGVRFYGNAAVLQGVLRLTANANSLSGTVVIDDFNASNVVTSFTATFKARVGGGTVPPADGFSFSFAPDYPVGVFALGEEGAGTGLTISFDTYANYAGDGPSIDVKSGGVQIANAYGDVIATGDAFVEVVVRVDTDGYLDVSYHGKPVYEHLLAFKPSRGRFALAARTGGLNDFHLIDDLSITTTVAKPPPLPPRITNIVATVQGVIVSWPGEPGVSLQHTPSLLPASWQDVAGSLGSSSATDPVVGPTAFYRLIRR